LHKENRPYQRDNTNRTAISEGQHKQNSNIRDLYRAVEQFQKGYQSAVNLTKEKEERLANSQTLNAWVK
jgi:hypothetical protein